jgi:hypothetical protein
MYKKLIDILPELNELREKGVQRGNEVGWDWELFPFTVMLGKTTYIGAAPASGKTEIWFEILINLSCKYEWNHIVYSPETGSAHEIYSELCYKFIGKPYVKNKGYEMSEAELVKAENFINKHFIVIDPINEDLTLERFYELCDEIENLENKKFHTTMIDPWNELKEEFLPEDLGREDKYLSRILGKVSRNARKTQRHNCVITHVRDQAPVTKDAKTFFPMPTARDMAGGQTWFRKGYNMLMIWRPPYGLVNENGRMYEENEVHIQVAKVKPKGTAKKGTFVLYLDTQRYQYYMIDNRGERVYANRKQFTYQHEINTNKVDLTKIGMEVNHYYEPKIVEDDDMPF